VQGRRLRRLTLEQRQQVGAAFAVAAGRKGADLPEHVNDLEGRGVLEQQPLTEAQEDIAALNIEALLRAERGRWRNSTSARPSSTAVNSWTSDTA
jgi:hypothetical protein